MIVHPFITLCAFQLLLFYWITYLLGLRDKLSISLLRAACLEQTFLDLELVLISPNCKDFFLLSIL